MVKKVNYSFKVRKNGSVLCNKAPSFYSKENILRVTFEDNVACMLELVDSKNNVIAVATVSTLTPTKRKIADTERLCGFILNPILFLQRLWEMIESKTADIITA